MFTLVRGGGRLPLKVFTLALGTWIFTGSSLMADDVGHTNLSEGRFKHDNLGEGTLGWAEYGVYPGLYGFRLRWHVGYRYRRYAVGLVGHAWGVGADGGYPSYGGPGYLHEPPPLRRFGPAPPFAYFGGPEYPCD